jgi:choline dehydrogenase
MREVFVRMEHNNYLPQGTPGHGMDGYFGTNMNNGSCSRAASR